MKYLWYLLYFYSVTMLASRPCKDKESIRYVLQNCLDLIYGTTLYSNLLLILYIADGKTYRRYATDRGVGA